MKRALKILAATAACTAVAGLAGCSSASGRIVVDSYWYLDNIESIQPTIIDPETQGRTGESLLYELTFDSRSGGNNTFRAEYYTDSEDFAGGDTPHYLRTVFYATTFDWSADTNEKYTLTLDDRKELSEEDAARLPEGTMKETVYVLETQFEVSGAYVFGDGEATDENSVQFTDYMNTVTYFRSSRNYLQPVYSRKSVHTTSPSTISPPSAEFMCTEITYEYEVFYNFDCTEATSNYTQFDDEDKAEDTQQKTIKLNSGSHTLFDNNVLYTAVRGMSLSQNFAATLSLVIPENMGVFNVSVVGGTQGELDTEKDADIIAALTDAYGKPTPPESEDSEEGESGEESEAHSYLYYNPVSITSADGKGVTRTAWYAAVEDEDNNTYRATMLYLAQPLSYGLGTWEFRLAEVESVLGALK